ncbi:DUF262 domain-containing protein [Acidobacteriia bacterium AH_259_A11_L15]|nr:DUF262 domain-containing protein [Acidobacteriia bacterium AH_259_A11_L15]
MLLKLPVPEIYIQQTTSPQGETTYSIVDGQQRIRTVIQFIGSEREPDEQEYNKFALDKLPAESQWRNKTFADLTDEEKKVFYGYNLAVRYLNTDNEGELRDMFNRLNRFLSPLKPQELRNATYTGPFVKLALDLADDDYWATNSIVTPASIRRMGDVEFVSELLIGALHGPQGGSAKVIDLYYERYEDYEDEFPNQKRGEELFEQTLRSVQKLLPKIKKTRWGNKTGFYTLFAAVAFLVRNGRLRAGKIAKARKTLENFASEIDRRLADENAKVSRNAVRYVRAVEKGANDKKRRAVRHTAVLDVMGRYFM